MIEDHAEFLHAFETCTLPAQAWTHSAHIRMAWLYLTTLPFDQAREKICTGIRRYNGEVLHVPHKYHDTVTVAYARIIANRVSTGESWPDFESRNADLFDPAHNPLRDFYRAETLASDEARLGFVAPDLQELPDLSN